MTTTVSMSNNGRLFYVFTDEASGIFRRIPGTRWVQNSKCWAIKPSRVAAQTVSQMADLFVSSSAAELFDGFGSSPSVELDWPKNFKFKTEPYSYQKIGSAKVYGRRESCLAADPGLGKSKMCIDGLSAKFLDGTIERVLIVAPKTVRMVWAQEFDKHCPVPYDIKLVKDSRKSIPEFKAGHLAVLVATAENIGQLLARSMGKRFIELGKCALVIDESHLMKNPQALRTKACIELSKKCVSSTIISGTLIGNGIEDLFSQFNILHEKIIGYPDFYSFRDRYCKMGGYMSKKIVGYQNTEELKSSIDPYIFRARFEDCLSLPPKVYITRVVEMQGVQARDYKELADKKRLDYREIETTNSLDLMVRLHHIAGGFVPIMEKTSDDVYKSNGYEHINTSKVDEVLVLCEEYANQSMVIWCNYRHEIQAVFEALSKKYGLNSVVQIHGDVSEQARATAIRALQSGDARFMVSTQSSGGVGTTMVAANVAVYYSSNFSYINRKQSEDRIYRIGQNKTVLIVDLITDDSIDVLIMQALQAKSDLAQWLDSNKDRLDIQGMKASVV